MGIDIQQTLNFYCDNEMAMLKKMCIPMINKIGGISYKDYDDFYEIALDTLGSSVFKYDEKYKCSFDCFLASNIKRKFNTEVRDRNREKRIPAKKLESTNNLVTEDGLELGETIPSKFDTHEEACGSNFEGTNAELYLNRLSKRQRRIVDMICLGFEPKDIRKKLHISKKDYDNDHQAITSYENKRLLKRKTYKKQVV